MARHHAQYETVGTLGATDYRNGALERLAASYTLLRAGRFADTIYLAGRGVEAILRAVIWNRDTEVRRGAKSLETGHDLRELLAHVRDLGLLDPGGRDERFTAAVQRVARLWFNNMRFASSRFVETRWLRLGELGRGRTFKQAAAAFHDDCSAIVKRCEALCQRSNSKRP